MTARIRDVGSIYRKAFCPSVHQVSTSECSPMMMAVLGLDLGLDLDGRSDGSEADVGPDDLAAESVKTSVRDSQ